MFKQLTLLSELGLSLLDGADEHVSDSGGGKSVKSSTDSVDCDNKQVLGSGVVGAVHHGSDGETE